MRIDKDVNDMQQAISKVKVLPPMDSMPVMKVLRYPLERADFKPFAQARMCYLDGQGIFLMMWSFEVQPICRGDDNDSFLIFKAQVAGEQEICIKVNRQGVYRFTVNGWEHSTDEIPCKMFTGEDLQGIYWGCELFITNSLLKSIYGVTNLETGHMIKGNIFKTCDDSTFRHHGCLFCSEEQAERFDPAKLDNLGVFEIVDY